MNVTHLSFAIFAFMVSFLLEMTATSMSVHWSIDPFIVYAHPFPFQVAFGLLIPFSVGSLVFFVLLLLDSQTKIYFASLTVLVVVVTALSIGLTCPPSLRSWVDRWDSEWSNTSHSMSFQYEKSCCGWHNFRDRAISDCPFLSISGCVTVVETWIYSRYSELLLTYCFIAALHIYSLGVLVMAIFKYRIDCIWAQIEIPFLSSILYRG
jgi:hypothetical protein